MNDQTTDQHTCHNEKTAAGPAWKCPRCSLPPAHQTAPLADRLAHPEAVREQLRRALDFTYAVSLGYESSDELLATYDASRTQAVDDSALSVAEARDRLRGMALTLATGEGPLVEPWAFNQALDDYQAAVAAAVLPATTNHDTDTSAELRAEVEQWRATFGRDALPGALRRLERAEAERDSLGREADRLRNDWVEMRDRAERAEADRAAVLREAADHLDNSERLRDLTDNHMLDINAAANELRRVADETAATETPDEAWQREWDRRPDGADVSDLFEITAVVPCSGTLFSAHPPHTWEPQPGVPAVHCPGERQPAAGARQDGEQP